MRGYCVKSFSKAFPLMTTRKQMCEDSSEKTRQAMAGIAIGPAVQKIAVEVGSISLAKAGRNAMEKTINVFFFTCNAGQTVVVQVFTVEDY